MPVAGSKEVEITAGLSGAPTARMRADRNPAVRFDGLELTELTRFLIVRAVAGSVTVTRTVGISLEGVDEKEFADALWAKETRGGVTLWTTSRRSSPRATTGSTSRLSLVRRRTDRHALTGRDGPATCMTGRPLLERLLALTRDESDAGRSNGWRNLLESSRRSRIGCRAISSTCGGRSKRHMKGNVARDHRKRRGLEAVSAVHMQSVQARCF